LYNFCANVVIKQMMGTSYAYKSFINVCLAGVYRLTMWTSSLKTCTKEVNKN